MELQCIFKTEVQEIAHVASRTRHWRNTFIISVLHFKDMCPIAYKFFWV